MAEHTPTPWRIDPRREFPKRIIANDPKGKSDVPWLVPINNGEWSDDNPEAAANAAFIVKAVNHHQALVAMVHELREEVGNWPGDAPTSLFHRAGDLLKQVED